MIITCEQCATQYQLARKRIRPTGSKVRCSKCHHVFVALPSTENAARLAESSVFASSASEVDEQPLSLPDDEQSHELTTPSSPSSMKSEDIALSKFDHAPDEPLAEGVEIGENRTLEKLDNVAGDELELPELSDKLDKIFGASETDDGSIFQGDRETAENTEQNQHTEEIEILDLSELEDEFDPLLDNDQLAQEEIADEVPKASRYGDSEMLDLSELGDEFDKVPENGAPGKGAIGTGAGFAEITEAPSLEELDDELDEAANKNKEPVTEIETEIDFDLEKEPLSTEDDDKMDDKFKPETLTHHDQSDDLGENFSFNEKAIGRDTIPIMDTIQIQDFESDLDDLEDIKPEINDEDFGLDTRQIESFDLDLEDLDELPAAANEAQSHEPSEQDEDLNLDTPKSESFNLDLEDLDELPAAANEAQSHEPSEQDEDLNLDTPKSESFDLDLEDLDELPAAANEAQSHEPSEQDEDLNLDTPKSESFDLDLENLDEPELDGEEAPPKEVSEQNEHFVLDTNQIKSLDLELENPDEQDLTADETTPTDISAQDEHFVLDTNQIKSLDLDLENSDDSSLSDADQNADIILDTDQIKSLSLEVDNSDKSSEDSEPIAPDKQSKESSVAADNISADTDRGKTAEVLNLNLERPDLEGLFDMEEEIDLPVLDELLAPADVTDETLIDKSFDSKDDSKSDLDEKLVEHVEEIAPVSDLDDKWIEQLEESSPDDSQPILELDAIDRKTDATQEAVEPEEAQPEIQAEATTEATVSPDAERQTPIETKTTMEPVDAAIAAEKMAGSGRFETLPQQRSGKWLMVPLVILLLLALLFGINAMGVNIPFLSNLNIPFLSGGGQLANDPGSARIKTVDIDSKFISNKKSGRLFVITGEILNQYDNARGFIQIKGNIYASGGQLVETKSVHCGNFLSDKDLAAKPFADIQRYLTNKLGAGGAGTLKVGPGKTLPFMIVFADLPNDIEEFSVEIIDSAAL